MIKFPPFGRGSQSRTDQVDSFYQSLRTADIEANNFHPDARLSETHFDFDAHKHYDGSLADSTIGDLQLDYTKGGSNNAKVLLAASPRTLCVFGSYFLNFPSLQNRKVSLFDVDFASTSIGGVTFPPGVIPSVFPSFYDYAYSGPYCVNFLTSITSEGFQIGFWQDYQSPDMQLFGCITYLAVGCAVGALARP